MYRIIGLGNLGEEYEKTPHNIGMEILEKILEKYPASCFQSKSRQSSICEVEFENQEVEFIFFENFMNNSGTAFNRIFNKKNEKEKEKIIVIQDDVDLKFGEIRISFNRGNGGHNGIKDIVKKIKTKKFIRIRIGVCPVGEDGLCHKPQAGERLNNYLVYKKLPNSYQEKYLEIEKKVEEILKEIIKNGYQKAMNRFN